MRRRGKHKHKRYQTHEQRRKHAQWSTAKARRVRNEWIESQGRQCARCKVRTGDDHPYPAYFWHCDHIDPTTKTYEPRNIWHRRSEVRNAELHKCQLLCFRCHRWKSTRDGSHPREWRNYDYVAIRALVLLQNASGNIGCAVGPQALAEVFMREPGEEDIEEFEIEGIALPPMRDTVDNVPF